MQNDDKTLLSISPAGHGQLVKMLITLEPHGIISLRGGSHMRPCMDFCIVLYVNTYDLSTKKCIYLFQ